MHTSSSRLQDDQQVGVTLSPILAKEVARALRIRLACEIDHPLGEPLPSREDMGRLRTTLDLCVGQLEALDWGEPSGEVRMMAPRLLLETIAEDLRGGGDEQVANPLGWSTAEARNVRRHGRQMIRAADAIDAALDSERQYQVA